MPESRLLDNLDLPTILTALLLAGVGLFSVASASAPSGDDGLWRMQLLWVGVAVVAAVVIIAFDYHLWAEVAVILHGVVIVLLVLVLVFGREVGGNRSWLVIGPARLQPSELAKWTTCLVLAVYLSRRVRGSLGLRQLLEMGVVAGVPIVLIAMQPDMGTAMTFVPIYLAALIMGGVRWKVILGLAVLAVLLAPVAWTSLATDYQKERILTVFDPGRDPSGYGYQVRQSKIAIGSGGVLGKGLFQGTQSQLNFLPAQHTDFVLSVFAEQLGFVGVTALLAGFYYLFYRGIIAARSAQDRLGTYTCTLVVAWLAGQLSINVGMVLGQLPTIGVPLPLVSYGGSSLVSTICGVALIVNVRSRRFVN